MAINVWARFGSNAHLGGLSLGSEALAAQIAKCRDAEGGRSIAAGEAMESWLYAPGYWISRLVFLRALAAVYLIAFLVAANQFRPLLGERGMLPVPRFLRIVPFRRAPSLFHAHYSDRRFAAVAWVGAALAAWRSAGWPTWPPAGAAMAVWVVLWALYLSIVNVGQTFYGFGWETLLLEAGFLAIFLGPPDAAPPAVILGCSALAALPGRVRRRADQAARRPLLAGPHLPALPPRDAADARTRSAGGSTTCPPRCTGSRWSANHVTQLVVPVLLFTAATGRRHCRGRDHRDAAVADGERQLLVAQRGSRSPSPCPHSATACSAGCCRSGPRASADAAVWHDVIVVAVAAVVATLSYRPVANLLSRHQMMNTTFDPLRLVNSYGAFGSVTRVRREVVVEGTTDEVLTSATVWREYGFKAKPGDPRRRPRQFAPYHLRIDWLMWFLPLSPRYGHAWFRPFLARLLTNDPDTIKLLRTNPFPTAPPAYVRARLYRYRFTTGAERRATGAWWHRDPIGDYVRPQRLPARDETRV